MDSVSGGGAWALACLDLAVLNPVVEFGRVEANEFADLQIRDSAFFDQSSNESWLDVHEFGYLVDVEQPRAESCSVSEWDCWELAGCWFHTSTKRSDQEGTSATILYVHVVGVQSAVVKNA